MAAGTVDLLVIGAGAAGLTTALGAAERGLSVTVIAAGAPDVPGARVVGDHGAEHTATHFAQGGVAVPTDADGVVSAATIDAHVADTITAGAGHTDPRAARTIIERGPDAVQALIRRGARFDTASDGIGLARTREGGHRVRRIVHAGGDATGAEVHRALWAATRRAEYRLAVQPGVRALDVVIVGGRVVGAVVCAADNETFVVRAHATVLATGGAGQLYATTTNPSGAIGSGIAMALRAGAGVTDLEFVQFHPTMLSVPGTRGRTLLISEAIRGEGARLIDGHGRSVTAHVHPLGDLAPRDVVAAAIADAVRGPGRTGVFLDARAVPDLARRFPTVTAGVRAVGIDPVTTPIPVTPGAHYLCGGVITDTDGRTGIPGLYAAGEVARTGLHGANRLASNSLLEALVMGERIAAVAAGAQVPLPVADSGVDAAVRRARRLRLLGVRRSLDEVQDVMSAHAGVTRDDSGLARAAYELATGRSAEDSVDATLVAAEVDATLVAAAVVESARRRRESRGCHRRSDHPAAAIHSASGRPRRPAVLTMSGASVGDPVPCWSWTADAVSSERTTRVEGRRDPCTSR